MTIKLLISLRKDTVVIRKYIKSFLPAIAKTTLELNSNFHPHLVATHATCFKKDNVHSQRVTEEIW